MKRITLPVLPALLLAALLTGMLAALAPASASAAVTRSDLPVTERVANTFSYLHGGSRAVDRSQAFELYRDDCITYRSGVPVRSARLASYLLPSGQPPFFRGKEDPTFGVYEYADPAEARRAFAQLRRSTERCLGTHRGSGVRRTISTFDVPRLGTRELGIRTTTDNGGIDRSLEVYVRHGDRIERSWIQLDRGQPSRAHVVRMARVLADVAR